MDDTQRLRIFRPDEEELPYEGSASPRVGIRPEEFVASDDTVLAPHEDIFAPVEPAPERIPGPTGILSHAGGLLRRFMLFTGYIFAICWLTGCSALRPLHGIPVRQLPPELRGTSRAGMETIDLSRLSQTPPPAHIVDTGDLLGVYIYGILGKIDETPPVYVPQTGDGNPTIGLPIPVRDDGTISLPQIPPLFVRGMTVRQVEEAVRREYVSRGIREDGVDILVSLQRSRTYQVTVLRQETANAPSQGLAGGGIQLGVMKKGTGQIIRLPAGENDVLRALTMTGGLPGLDAQNAIYVLRRPRRARPTPLTANNTQADFRTTFNRQQSSIILTGGDDRYGSRHGVTLATDDSMGEDYTQAGHSWPTYNTGTQTAEQPFFHPDSRSNANAPWNQTVSRSNPRPSSTGFGYSTPTAIPSAGNRGRDEQYAEQLPEPSFAKDGNNAAALLNGQFNPGVDVPSQTPIVAGGNQHVPPELQPYMMSGAQVFRIPIRLHVGEQAYFNECDILLYDGDIIFIESRDSEIFYTSGLLGGGQFSLPQTYDLDVLEAISIAQGGGAGGSGGGGGFGNRIGGISAVNQDISVSASRLIVIRRLPDGRRVNIKVDINKALRDENENLLVQPGDHLILRYTPVEAIAAFIERNLLAGSLIGLASTSTGGGAK